MTQSQDSTNATYFRLVDFLYVLLIFLTLKVDDGLWNSFISNMFFTEDPSTPPLDISRYHLHGGDEEEVDEDGFSLQNEFNPFDPVWGILYRSKLHTSVKDETKCLEKEGTLAASVKVDLQFLQTF